MQKLVVFNSVTMDGYFTGPGGDLSWAKEAAQDPEWTDFVSGNASGGGTLVFGRVTYDMMAGFWPTPAAMKDMPQVARGMNEAPKVVFSRSLDKANWNNTRVVKDNLVEEVKRLKNEPGKGITILGSGSLVAQLAPHGVIDQYQFVMNPVVLGTGRTMFEGIPEKLRLELLNTRAFRNGNVVVSYRAKE